MQTISRAETLAGHEPSATVVIGEVVHITHRDSATGFVVGSLRASDGATEIRFRGTHLPGVAEGVQVRFEGEWQRHPVHGPQFEVHAVRTDLPRTREGVVRYISCASGIPGCGPKRAEQIVDRLGLGCLTILAEDPERIADVFPKGKVGIQMLEGWRAWATRYRDQRAVEEICVRLLGVEGITPALAERIVAHFGPEQAKRVLLHRPYDLCQVRGIGFRTADAIALSQGVAKQDPTRVAAGVVHVLEVAMGDGHSCLPRRLIVGRVRKELGLGDSVLISNAIEAGLSVGTLVARGDLVFTALADRAERRVASAILALVSRSDMLPAEIRSRAEEIIAEDGLSEEQGEAVLRALESGAFVLTGRPGAGKTTTVKTFLRCADLLGGDLAVAAPTGKAASRASEVTGRAAMTVHRLIGVPVGEVRKSPLDVRWLVLDESSMCDLMQIDWLLRNIDLTQTSILFVGDVHQLPSVEHGQVLADFLSSGVLPSAMLNQVFRQSQESLIKVNANHILDGEPLDLGNPEGSDFLFADVTLSPPLGPDGFPIEDPHQSRRECEWARVRLKRCIEHLRAQGADPARDIQILTLMRRGLLGVEEINRLVQDVVNPDGERGPVLGDGNAVRVGDRVIQTRNDYTLGVFNGDQGVVEAVDPQEGSIVVRFEQGSLVVGAGALRKLHLSWAITVHRSQGSEFPFCILLYHTSQYIMLARRILYTAITRAKRQLILIGSRAAVDQTLRRPMDHEERHTGLAELLSEALVPV